MKHTKNFNKINNNKCCPECGSTNFDEINAETVCKNCGLVVSAPYSYVGGVKTNTDYTYDYTSTLERNLENRFKTKDALVYKHNKSDRLIVKLY